MNENKMTEEIIDVEEVKDWTTPFKRGHKYWRWKPWRKKDNWEPLKKNGRKKWTVMIQEASVELEVGTVFNYVTYGRSKIENAENKKRWLKPHTPMSIPQACKEYWIHPTTFYQHLNKFPSIKEKYEVMKINRREYLKEIAEHNMTEILEHWDLTDKERFDSSFKVAQATMKEFNPKTEIESKTIWINLSKTSDDLKADLASLLWLTI